MLQDHYCFHSRVGSSASSISSGPYFPIRIVLIFRALRGLQPLRMNQPSSTLSQRIQPYSLGGKIIDSKLDWPCWR